MASVSTPALLLQPGTLWPAIRQRTAHALQCGALRPFETVATTIRDAGVDFVVRQVSSLADKEQDREDRDGSRRMHATAPDTARPDPFLPYDPDLFVADVSDTHVALLNKFNVIGHHLLIVTRAFVPQASPLTEDDFAALFACMAEFDSLGFYNCGPEAGASQPHKHMQVVPLPLGANDGEALPIDPLLAAAPMAGTVVTIPGLPFAHAFAPLAWRAAPAHEMARIACERCRVLLDAIGVRTIHAGNDDDDGGRGRQCAPYNLLVMPRGMLAVPRSSASMAGIPVNALGFVGSLFVRDAVQRETVARIGPMTILRGVAGPAAA